MADRASDRNAKKDMLISEAEESVKMLSCPSLILFVNGIAEDADDINRYATTCNLKYFKILSNYTTF